MGDLLQPTASTAVASGKGSAIARDLASLVVSQALTPGTLLPPEQRLVAAHGASRPVIREAIRRLAGAGLVETRHGVGSIVNPPRRWNVFDPIVLKAHLDNHDLPALLDELLEVRRVVEVEAAGLAAARIVPDELTALAVSLERMARDLDHPDRFAQLDFTFHEMVLSAAGNRFFDGIFRYVRDALWEGRQLTSRSGGVAGRERAHGFHRALHAAIAAGDPDEARAVMHEHLAVAESDLRAALMGVTMGSRPFGGGEGR